MKYTAGSSTASNNKSKAPNSPNRLPFVSSSKDSTYPDFSTPTRSSYKSICEDSRPQDIFRTLEPIKKTTNEPISGGSKPDKLALSFGALSISLIEPTPTSPVPESFPNSFSSDINRTAHGSTDGWVTYSSYRQTPEYNKRNESPRSTASPSPTIAEPFPRSSGEQRYPKQHALETPPIQYTSRLMTPRPITPPLRPRSAMAEAPANSHFSPTPVDTDSTRLQVSSAPSTPSGASSKKGTLQCSGITTKRRRCVKRVPVSTSALANIHPDAEIEVFCYYHVKEVNASNGFISRKANHEYVTFEERWIPRYLQEDTKAALRSAITKDPSPRDKPGYIYVIEYRDPDTPTKIHLKVGKAEDLNERIDSWSRKCKSKEQILRGWWPGTVEYEGDAPPRLLKGMVIAGEKGPLYSLLETLVHLELADLVVHTPDLHPVFQTVAAKKKNEVYATSGGTPKRPVLARRSIRTYCSDCRHTHIEIFSFDRIVTGPYEGMEWEHIVKPVIKKWGEFVRKYYV